ncbi:Small auxin-up RNA [Parasponia andersonii]|uniref:Small auxin-up RNA n=1 Tax=Parasponia andersonii TaxID=3476 RepID=A0A2P5CGY0_PARAD|nr:Small auxin-up RNA [Parasponia andersonii]
MAKAINYKGARKGSLGILRFIVGKIQTSLSLSRGVKLKQGHFVVIATESWKPERFVVELGYLNNPEFLMLLKQAEEEFGFSQEGALAIPCRPDDLQRILGVRNL